MEKHTPEEAANEYIKNDYYNSWKSAGMPTSITDLSKVDFKQGFIKGEAQGEAKVTQAKALITELFNLPHFSLEDHVYDVREHEGEGWEGPAVKKFSDLIDRLREFIKDTSGKEAATDGQQ